jgi:hypothetical protein
MKNSEENSYPQTKLIDAVQATAKGQSIRSDALYPALSAEWEVPVTRNAKITGGWGAPPLRGHLWQGPPFIVAAQQRQSKIYLKRIRRAVRVDHRHRARARHDETAVVERALNRLGLAGLVRARATNNCAANNRAPVARIRRCCRECRRSGRTSSYRIRHPPYRH